MIVHALLLYTLPTHTLNSVLLDIKDVNDSFPMRIKVYSSLKQVDTNNERTLATRKVVWRVAQNHLFEM
jgi:hypothetical protein